jgi:hypothetical protein
LCSVNVCVYMFPPTIIQPENGANSICSQHKIFNIRPCLFPMSTYQICPPLQRCESVWVVIVLCPLNGKNNHKSPSHLPFSSLPSPREIFVRSIKQYCLLEHLGMQTNMHIDEHVELSRDLPALSRLRKCGS